MSDLQVGLLAIGAVVVVAVLAYNKWQEIKYRRETEAGLKAQHGDVLMGEAEAPATPLRSSPAASQGAPRAERIEPTFESPETEAEPAAHRATEAASGVSEMLDFIVTIEAQDGVEGTVLLQALGRSLEGYTKSARLEGFDPDGAQWAPLRPEGRYTLMRAGLQLVDRQGVASDIEFATFGAGVQQAATALGALATVPDMGAAMVRANDLDKFCSEVDILIELRVAAAATPFPGTKIRALAEANGLMLEGDGRFRRRDDEGRTLYELGSTDAAAFSAEAMRSMSVTGLALELDVPRTPDPVRAFDQFRELAGQLAQTLEGSVVDENRAPVSPAAFDQIRARIQNVQRAMAGRGIEPGSGPALRLFS